MITVVNKVSEKVPYSTVRPGEFFAMDNGRNLYYKMDNGYIHIGQEGYPYPRGDGYVTRSSPVLESFAVSQVEVIITIS